MSRCEDMMFTLNKLDKIVNLIKSMINTGNENILFYDYLIKQAPNEEQKNIIENIKNDQINYNKTLRNIYKDITGNMPPEPRLANLKKPSSYVNGIKQALLNQLNSIQKYTDIYLSLPLICYKNMLFKIIINQITNSMKFNYILYLNCCEKLNKPNKPNRPNRPNKNQNLNRSLDDDFFLDYPIYQRFPDNFDL